MKRYLFKLSLLLLCCITKAFAQSTSCDPNLDWELGNFSYWKYYQVWPLTIIPGTSTAYICDTLEVFPPSAIGIPPRTPTTYRMNITSGSGTSLYGGFPVVFPDGGKYSFRLGRELGSGPDGFYGDIVSYNVHVPSWDTNFAIVYNFALVITDPGHSPEGQPKFMIRTRDSATKELLPCGQHKYVAGSLPGFIRSALDYSVFYKPWATGIIPLGDYTGKTITIDFIRENCYASFHVSCGYFDVKCGSTAVQQVNQCDSVHLSAPMGFQQYLWMDSSLTTLLDTGQNISVARSKRPINYKLIVNPYTGYGCPDTMSIIIPPLLELEIKEQSTCAGKTISLNPIVKGSISPLTYKWSPGTGLSCDTCEHPSLTPLSYAEYLLKVTDTAGCSVIDTAIVSIYPQPKIKADDHTICQGDYAAITASGALKYFWTPATGLYCDTCATPAFNPTVTTIYTVRGTDTNGCVDSTLVKITVNNPLQITVDSAGPVCAGTKVLLRARGSLSYSWSPAASLSCTSCDSTISSALASTKYTVIGTDANSCKDTAYLNLKVHPLPLIKTNGNTEVCEGNSLRMYASGALTYIWSPSSELSCTNCDSPIVLPKNNTLYTVVGTDSNGCIDSGKLQISVFHRKPVTISANDSVCKGEKVQLFAGGGTHYQWIPATNLSSDTIASPTAKPDKTIAYTVIVRQGMCFVDTVHVGIFVQEPPNVAITGDSIANYGAPAHLYASGSNIESYKWAQANELSCTDCSNPTATMTQTKTFTLIVTGPMSCKSEAEFTVRVFDCNEDNIFIPNTFTPNGDGLNDTFYPIGHGVKLVKDFYVYNRWGEIVYEAHDFALNDPKTGWDGSYKGEKIMGDVFIYYVNAICEKGNYLKLKGDISVVK